MTTPKNKFVLVRAPPAETKVPPSLDEKIVPRALSVSRGVVRTAKKGRRGAGKVSNLPPSIPTTVHRHRMMYTSSGDSDVAITRAYIGMSIGGTCSVANSTVNGIASSFRIRKLTIWPAAGTNASITWLSSTAEQALAKDGTVTTIVPTGIAVTGGTVYRPPRGSWTSMWQVVADNPTDAMLQLTLPAGSAMLVELDWTQMVVAQPYGQAGYTSATLGKFYYPPFDGLTSHKVTVLDPYPSTF